MADELGMSGRRECKGDERKFAKIQRNGGREGRHMRPRRERRGREAIKDERGLLGGHQGSFPHRTLRLRPTHPPAMLFKGVTSS